MHSLFRSALAVAVTFVGIFAFATADADAQAEQADDVVGLKVGMSYDEIVAVLKSRDDVGEIETAEQWIRESHGLPTRQLLRASDGTACAEGEAAMNDGAHIVCDTFGDRFQARKDITNEIIVAFIGMPGEEIAGSIWRRTVFPDGANPTVATLEEALAKKYGEPHIRQTDSGYYSMSHRMGATMLNWIHTPEGMQITDSDALRSGCVNGPKAWFTTQHSWNGACGLTVRAEILPVPNNRLVSRELNVTVVRQKDLIDGLGRFDAELKAAVEDMAGQAAGEPDL